MLRTFFRHFFLTIILLVLLWPQKSFASDPPNLISPSDGTTESKPKLTWEYKGECVESGSCFRVEVDNNSDFSSPEKSTYDTNTSYSPQGLANGTYYWRVKAKDKSDTWSDWSKVFKFTIGAQPINPSPTASSSPSQNSPTPQPSTSPQKTSGGFSIKEIPSEINSNSEFEVEVSLTLPGSPSQQFYLKGAFKKGESSNYFGETFTGNDWIKNSSSASRQYKIDTDSSGKWEGKIKIRPDSEDSGFEGSGDYFFKVARYSSSGSGPNWSNELSLKINAVEVAEDAPETLTAENSEEKEEVDITESLVKTQSERNYEFKIASVAGEATMSNNIPLEEHVAVLEEKKVNWLLIFLGLAILVGGIGYGVYRLKN